ncbi:unnamed protein product [marine sediment metagenome]|uniref:Uncharacterized protein n=1 Tax=marine sediment metagenome TaxID=412755 RepID=X1DWB3_9ZZZZ
MSKETIIVLPDGSQYRLTPKGIKFAEDLEKFFAKLGIPKEDIPVYLEKLAHPNGASNL